MAKSALIIGTGTGVLPRNMYKYGADWTGTDISENQIIEAQQLAKEAGMSIDFYTCDAKDIKLENASLDVITACQCIWYLNHEITAPRFSAMLKDNGSFLILYMGWLPYEDEIAGKSEDLILKYNPKWTGCRDTVHPVWVPDEYLDYFVISKQEEFRVDIPFTKDSWNGRMRACRGTSASMSPETLAVWENEHIKMLENYPESFCIKHYISVAWLRKK
ncbi:class I SAM-dependent methyltransferase [Methanobrevibacter ruminantium]|uniref:class I SAM-dependent methyltransferase n=1 Tax=Methanobrevibacter ruminantium TaxID=83816 RepID=UPI0026F20C34|nr:class I SAM-dependent methyltransferase [Methanobrevibacter ruminantium]